MTVAFTIGEVVNPDDWGLRVQITALDPLEAIVIKNDKPTSYVGTFFPIGKRLRFTPGDDGTSWLIDDPDKNMPWFVLGIYEGRKRFEHYR